MIPMKMATESTIAVAEAAPQAPSWFSWLFITTPVMVELWPPSTTGKTNDPAIDTNVNISPTSMPGSVCGKKILQKVSARPAPWLLAARTDDWSMPRIVENTGRMNSGRHT